MFAQGCAYQRDEGRRVGAGHDSRSTIRGLAGGGPFGEPFAHASHAGCIAGLDVGASLGLGAIPGSADAAWCATRHDGLTFLSDFGRLGFLG